MNGSAFPGTADSFRRFKWFLKFRPLRLAAGRAARRRSSGGGIARRRRVTGIEITRRDFTRRGTDLQELANRLPRGNAVRLHEVLPARPIVAVARAADLLLRQARRGDRVRPRPL